MTFSRRILMADTGGPIEFVSYASSTSEENTSTLSIPKPTGVIEGDLLVALMACNTNQTWTGDTSWIERVDQGVAPSLRVATLVAGASEPSSYTFTPGATRTLVGQILAFRNADYDTIGSIAAVTENNDLVMSQITSAGGILIAAIGSVNQSSRTHSTPAGMTITEHKFNEQSSCSAFYQLVGAGDTGTRTSLLTGGNGNTAGVLIGIKQA